jgi:hypothetical protein
MKKIWLLLICLCLTPARAEEVSSPADFPAYTLADQHGKEHVLQPETRTVIMSFDMTLSKGINEWLSKKDADYLAEHQAEYVVDISPMPAVINKLFAGPKMRKYKFPIIQATANDFADDYPHEEGKISLFALTDDQSKATVTFVKTVGELIDLFDPPQEASAEE